jgi:LexA-binding, inner membrane-associated putative hydrolase
MSPFHNYVGTQTWDNSLSLLKALKRCNIFTPQPMIKRHRKMFLVGHAALAFIISYSISRRFGVVRVVSFAAVMLITTLPDIDIITQEAGIIPHHTYTHSPIISVTISSVIFLIAKLLLKQNSIVALIYGLAYLYHIIGDLVIGSLNVLFPFGYLPIGLGIDFGSLSDEIIEMFLLVLAVSITLRASFANNSSGINNAILRYSRIDRIGFALLILALFISFAYLLYDIESSSRLFLDTELQITLFVLLHLMGVAWILLIVLVSRQFAMMAQPEQ